MQDERLSDFRRPDALEASLRYFEDLLGPIELNEIANVASFRAPILFIVGCARSGSTLIHQYLSFSGLFTYPSNFISRFYFAPYLGARLQQMLLASDFRGEIAIRSDDDQFKSALGKTLGPLAPHEFWYFWRRFFKFDDVQKLSSEAMERADVDLFLRELRALQSVAGKPLVMKGMILNWDIPFLACLSPDIHFLFVERAVEANSESLVNARRRFFGHDSSWYSFRPPGYQNVLRFEADRQAVWQVLATNAAIESGLAAVPTERVFRVTYEEFCAAPRELIRRVCERFELDETEASAELPMKFEVRALSTESVREWKLIAEDVRSALIES